MMGVDWANFSKTPSKPVIDGEHDAWTQDRCGRERLLGGKLTKTSRSDIRGSGSRIGANARYMDEPGHALLLAGRGDVARAMHVNGGIGHPARLHIG